MRLFDILGPVMVGPSSSHTAGAVRIGLTARKLLGDITVRTPPGDKLHGARNRRCNTPCDTCWIRRLSAYDIQVGYLSWELHSGRLAAVLEEGRWDSCASMKSPRFLRLRCTSEWWNEMRLGLYYIPIIYQNRTDMYGFA